MDSVRIVIGGDTFVACWEEGTSPATCAAFRKLLPFSQRLIHARWSGESCWVPLGDFNLSVGPENPVSEPRPGQILFHPAGISETEILVPYGPTRFSSVAGSLAGNHFLTIRENLARLAAVGRDVLWNGSRAIRFEAG